MSTQTSQSKSTVWNWLARQAAELAESFTYFNQMDGAGGAVMEVNKLRWLLLVLMCFGVRASLLNRLDFR